MTFTFIPLVYFMGNMGDAQILYNFCADTLYECAPT